MAQNIVVFVGILIVVVIAVAGAFMILGTQHNINSSSSGVTNTINTQGGVAIPESESVAYSKLSSMKTIGLLNFTNMITNTNTTNASPISIVYRGQAVGSYSVLSINVPFNLNYSAANNDWRMKINATSIPLFGNLTTYAIDKSGTMYSCSKTMVYYGNNGISNASIQCQIANNTVSGLNFNNMKNLSKYNLNISEVQEREYNSIPCLFIVASLKNATSPQTANNTVPNNFIANINMSACVYTQHMLPLNFSINVSAQNKTNSNQKVVIDLKMNEISMTNKVTAQEISTLPGPIVNSTASNGFGSSSSSSTGGVSQTNSFYVHTGVCNVTTFINLNNGYATCNNFKVVLIGVSPINTTTPYSVFNVYENSTGTLIKGNLIIDEFQNGSVAYNNMVLNIKNDGVFTYANANYTQSAIYLNTT